MREARGGRRGIIVLIDKPHGYLLALLAEGWRGGTTLFIIEIIIKA